VSEKSEVFNTVPEMLSEPIRARRAMEECSAKEDLTGKRLRAVQQQSAMSTIKAEKMPAQVVVSHMGDGTPIWLAHSLYETRLRGSHTEGRMSVFWVTSPAWTIVAPPHVHPNLDELLIVIAGKVISYTGPEHYDHVLKAGSFIFLPKGTIEGFKTEAEGATMVWIMTPSGNSEELFERVGQFAPSHTLPPKEYETPSIDILDDQSEKAGFQRVLGFTGKGKARVDGWDGK
jgi:ethanolamine utilization protein EutQ (cupin superfamily)